jgi:hypothetical protein
VILFLSSVLASFWIRRFAAAGPCSPPSFGYQSGLGFSQYWHSATLVDGFPTVLGLDFFLPQ